MKRLVSDTTGDIVDHWLFWAVGVGIALTAFARGVAQNDGGLAAIGIAFLAIAIIGLVERLRDRRNWPS